MSRVSQIVTFYLTCADPRAWLVISNDADRSRVVEMWNAYPNHWSASAWLRPGNYHCRYYSGDDKHAAYFGPASLKGSANVGMDGFVSVKLPKVKMNSHSVNILVVEDNRTMLLALEDLLRNEGYLVHIAEGYQTALEVVKKNRVDFAICDINLWDGDGCDLFKELQSLQTMKGIAITGYSLPEETEHYRDAGFGVVLRKPVHHSEITGAIALLSSLPSSSLSAAPAGD